MGQIKVRGVIEGFYGNPWTYEDRTGMLYFCSKVGLNAFIYAPKDDPYHRDLWREPYPTELAENLERLVEIAAENGIELIFALSPGKDLRYDDNGFKPDVKTVISKLQNAYNIGFRQFAVFFDDVEVRDGKKQAELLNSVNKQFIRSCDNVKPLITVPTEYFIDNMFIDGKVKPYTLDFSNQLDKDIAVLFTGREVCPDGLKQEDIDIFKSIYADRPIGVWWNYPVNDYLPNKPALGPLDKMDACEGIDYFFMNPMDRPEMSKIALFTGASYARDTKLYDEDLEWNKAIGYLFSDVSYEMKLFASEHQRLEGRSAHIGRADSPKLTEKYERFLENDRVDDAKGLVYELQKYLATYEVLKIKLPDKALKEIEYNIGLQKRRKEKDIDALQLFVSGELTWNKAVELLKKNRDELETCYVSKILFPL